MGEVIQLFEADDSNSPYEDWLEIESAKLDALTNLSSFIARLAWVCLAFYVIGIVL